VPGPKRAQNLIAYLDPQPSAGSAVHSIGETLETLLSFPSTSQLSAAGAWFKPRTDDIAVHREWLVDTMEAEDTRPLQVRRG
jgi:hypothetical protein